MLYITRFFFNHDQAMIAYSQNCEFSAGIQDSLVLTFLMTWGQLIMFELYK